VKKLAAIDVLMSWARDAKDLLAPTFHRWGIKMVGEACD
jgi:hypothetical protein